MFVIASIKVMGVKLHFIKSIFSTSTIHIEPTTVLNDACEMPFHVITIMLSLFPLTLGVDFGNLCKRRSISSQTCKLVNDHNTQNMWPGIVLLKLWLHVSQFECIELHAVSWSNHLIIVCSNFHRLELIVSACPTPSICRQQTLATEQDASLCNAILQGDKF